MIRAIAFDLGGVLVDVSMERAAAILDTDVDVFRDKAFDAQGQTLHAAMTVGGAPDRFLDHLSHQFDCDAATAHQAWASVVAPRPQALRLLNDLGALDSLHLTAWSNTDPLHFGTLEADFSALFSSTRALSFEVEAKKPDAAFFERGLKRANVSPSALLFVDDRPENVAAAKAAGICALEATSVASAAQVIADNVPAFRKSLLRTESLD